MKNKALIIAAFLLVGCAEVSGPKYNFKKGDNEGVICIKRSTKSELIYSIIPKYKNKTYIVDTHQEKGKLYIYTVAKDNNTSALPWQTLIPGVPNTSYISYPVPVDVYWGREQIDRFYVKDKGCFKKDGSEVVRIDKEYLQDTAQEKAIESVGQAIMQSFYESLFNFN
jgi:hypothetical protein